jgi:hypothetical protein
LDWNSFGGQWPNGDGKDLVVIHAHDSRLEIFIVGNDGALYHRWQERPGGSWNGKWESLGGKWPEASDPVVVVNADGRLEVFMVGNDKELYHRWQERPGGSWNGKWESLGGKWRRGDGKDFLVIINSDGRLEVFMVGNDKELYHRWQERPGGSWNGKWESLGGKWPEASDPVVVVNADGRLEVFMVGNDKDLYHRWQERPGGKWN